jgi:hypothetical protein
MSSLGNQPYSHLSNLVRGKAGEVCPIESNRSAARRRKPDDGTYGCCFPHAISAQENGHRAFLYLHCNSLKDVAFSIVGMHINQLQHDRYIPPFPYRFPSPSGRRG